MVKGFIAKNVRDALKAKEPKQNFNDNFGYVKPEPKKCTKCGQVFQSSKQHHNVCEKCQPKKNKSKSICLYCKKPIMPFHHHSRFCAESCQIQYTLELYQNCKKSGCVIIAD